MPNKGKTKFGINFLEESSRFFPIRPRFYTPSPRIFLQQLCFFIGKIFTFLKKTLYKHGNFKHLNNFHTFLGLQKAKFDS
jgi:chromosome condensin MukBEF MukE localization factor